jgi:hypothetical protein
MGLFGIDQDHPKEKLAETYGVFPAMALSPVYPTIIFRSCPDRCNHYQSCQQDPNIPRGR